MSTPALFVIRNPYDDHSRLVVEQFNLAHEKLALELRLSTVAERLEEVKIELANIERRLGAQG